VPAFIVPPARFTAHGAPPLCSFRRRRPPFRSASFGQGQRAAGHTQRGALDPPEVEPERVRDMAQVDTHLRVGLFEPCPRFAAGPLEYRASTGYRALKFVEGVQQDSEQQLCYSRTTRAPGATGWARERRG